ncbi:hypothetical protein ABEB36_014449 [Hypothenemus hampei]|uniref:Uncharacterized protein n=1 Tax=Hypothenemus hampei TaxID=57062 RepID=A0ABD1E1U8_HYPHA
MKKVNNMKTRMKAKTDKNNTGNKAIKMCEWEKILFEALQGDVNPTVSKTPDPQKENLQRPSSFEVLQNEAASSSSTFNSSICLSLPLPPPRKKALITSFKETEETRGLTTVELQSLVLMEQLQTLRIQREYYNLKIKKLQNDNNND